MKLENYVDHKCRYGYMTICTNCLPLAPRHVDTTKIVESGLPRFQCEICKKRSKPSLPKPKKNCQRCLKHPKYLNLEVCEDCWIAYVVKWEREHPGQKLKGPKDHRLRSIDYDRSKMA